MSAFNRILRCFRIIEKRLRRRQVYSSLHPYRVQRQDGDRLNLQAVNEGDDLLPEIPNLLKAHGMQGLKEVCRPGSIVLVGFQGGDPGKPFVAHFLEAQPLEAEIDAEDEIRVGADATRGGARLNDSVVQLLPPAMFTGTIGGSPATGMVVWAGQAMGNISTASAKVKVE